MIELDPDRVVWDDPGGRVFHLNDGGLPKCVSIPGYYGAHFAAVLPYRTYDTFLDHWRAPCKRCYPHSDTKITEE